MYDDENLQNVTLLVTKRARFFLRSFSWGNPKRNPKRRPPLRTTSRAPSYVVSFSRLAERAKRSGSDKSRGRHLGESPSFVRVVGRTNRPGRKRGRGYIGGINRIPIRGTCHLTASENLESYSRDYSSPGVELRHLLEKHAARFVHERRKTLPIRGVSRERVDRKANTRYSQTRHRSANPTTWMDLPLSWLSLFSPEVLREAF